MADFSQAGFDALVAQVDNHEIRLDALDGGHAGPTVFTLGVPAAYVNPTGGGFLIGCQIIADETVTLKQVQVVTKLGDVIIPNSSTAFDVTINGGTTYIPAGYGVLAQGGDMTCYVTFTVDGTNWITGQISTISVPPPASTGTTYDANGVLLLAPSVAVTTNDVGFTSVVKTNALKTFTYLQFAVRGPETPPSEHDTGFNPGVSFNGERTFQGALNDLPAGAYTVRVAYSLNGTTWVDGPTSSFTIAVVDPPPPPPLGDRRIAHPGLSGLKFPSLVFVGGTSLADHTAFGTLRGRPLDGMLTFASRDSGGFATYKQNWDSGTTAWLDAGKLLVWSMPHGPIADGTNMNQKGANNDYAADQRDFGAWLASTGKNKASLVLRIDWEYTGDWYPWRGNSAGGAAALKEAMRNFVRNVRAGGATQVKFGQCVNKGPSQSGVDFSAFCGGEFVDVIGIDAYDRYAPSFTQAQWNSEINRVPGLQTVRDFAVANGVMWSMDEGGNAWDGANGGGDNPAFWQFLWDFLNKPENYTYCAWHNTYNHDGEPSSLHHTLPTYNPQSWAYYKRPDRWGG